MLLFRRWSTAQDHDPVVCWSARLTPNQNKLTKPRSRITNTHIDFPPPKSKILAFVTDKLHVQNEETQNKSDLYKRGPRPSQFNLFCMHLLPFPFALLIAQTRTGMKGPHYHQLETAAAMRLKDDALNYITQKQSISDPFKAKN